MDFEGAFFNTEDYEKSDKKLGEGTFGKVYLVTKLDDETQYAKIINVQNIFKGKDQMVLMRESAILRSLDHPAIVKFYGVNFHSFDDPTQLEPTILTEYLPNGSLKVILKKEQRGLADHDWNATKKYICLLGISNALRYLHSKGILHRDLKPENILIDANYYPRVCDFGLSRCFEESISKSMQLSMTGKIGTPLYMAPELLEDDTHYGQGIDVYAFAILAYEIVSGKEPYSENGKPISLSNLVRKVLSGGRPEISDGITEPMKELLNRCWSQDIKERPSFDEIFEKLSTEFTYIDEDVDEEEINNYLAYLEEGEKKEKTLNETKKETNDKNNNIDNYQLFNEKKKNKKHEKYYFNIIKNLIESHGNISYYAYEFIKLTCEIGNVELVKYLISLDETDIAWRDIFIHFL